MRYTRHQSEAIAPLYNVYGLWHYFKTSNIPSDTIARYTNEVRFFRFPFFPTAGGVIIVTYEMAFVYIKNNTYENPPDYDKVGSWDQIVKNKVLKRSLVLDRYTGPMWPRTDGRISRKPRHWVDVWCKPPCGPAPLSSSAVVRTASTTDCLSRCKITKTISGRIPI